ncbi:hypothetical protein PIB30_018604 [Stylosanthes scabra]|uniref:Uncharacterized protein n=1 Tax=Stylosanthes scabra TaxID=79078 RepID=A0ABU6S872_9FABA|nr:hypothetical protein [Stylosanthes scabra]
MRKIVNDRGRLIGPRGSMNDGHPGLVPDRSGMVMITDRVDIRVKLGALVPYWKPHEFVILIPLLLKYFRCRWRLAVRFMVRESLLCTTTLRDRGAVEHDMDGGKTADEDYKSMGWWRI